MRVFVEYIFVTACFAVLLTALAMVAGGTMNPIVVAPLAGVGVMCAIFIRKLRFWLQLRYGRLGLMKPGFRMRLSKAERLRMESEPALSADGTEILAEDHPRRMVADALAALRKRWTDKTPDRILSDDEVRSLYYLHVYADPTGEKRATPSSKALRDIEDKTPFLKLRERVDAWYEARAGERAEYEEWLDRIGGGSMNHLIASGWKHFLTTQPAVDPELWHCIAANTHRIEENGRLRAAFWILAQEQCDKATASDFIRSFVHDRLLEKAVKRKDADTVTAFARVVRRYNAGNYVLHTIKTGQFAPSLEGYGDEAVARDLAKMEARRRLPALPRPVGLLAQTGEPPDRPETRDYTSALAFSPEKGLHLKPPRHDWSYAS